jgi:hypothetical protein
MGGPFLVSSAGSSHGEAERGRQVVGRPPAERLDPRVDHHCAWDSARRRRGGDVKVKLNHPAGRPADANVAARRRNR